MFENPKRVAQANSSVDQAQQVNEHKSMSQGFTISAGPLTTTTQKLTLNAPGDWLQGLAITSAASLNGLFVTLTINNYQIVLNADCNLYNPVAIHSIQFFDVIQKLSGSQDNIQLSINNTTGATVSVNATLLYLPL